MRYLPFLDFCLLFDFYPFFVRTSIGLVKDLTYD